MSGLLYYIPDVQRHRIGDMDQYGLVHVFGNSARDQTVAEVRVGPVEHSGVVIADKNADMKVGYYPGEQTWRKIPKSEAYVGYYADNKPTPGDLARKKQIQGHFVTLGNGNGWLVPTARQYVDEGMYRCALPTIAAVNDDGEWDETEVRSQYVELWNIAQRWWDSLSQSLAEEEGVEDDKPVQFNFSDLLDSAVSALSTNYKIGKAEASLLELLDVSTAQEVLLAVVDWPTVKSMLEKKTD